MNNIKELLCMFWAAGEIQEKYMYDKVNNTYKRTYVEIFNEIREKNPEIVNSIECRVFNLSLEWWNDLFDITEKLVEDEYGEYNDKNNKEYFNKHVKKYMDQYIK
jgi:predicted thioredoxin/glutaredoxin